MAKESQPLQEVPLDVEETSSSESIDYVDEFLKLYCEDILDICDDFRERFSYNPYFLANMTPTNLMDFCIDARDPKLLRKYQDHNVGSSKIERFETEYKKELGISYHIMHSFFKKVLKKGLILAPVTFETWSDFCICMSNLSELKWSYGWEHRVEH